MVTHFDVAMATRSVPVSFLLKIKYYHLQLHGTKYTVKEETQWKVGLAHVLDKTRYFAFWSRKW